MFLPLIRKSRAPRKFCFVDHASVCKIKTMDAFKLAAAAIFIIFSFKVRLYTNLPSKPQQNVKVIPQKKIKTPCLQNWEVSKNFQRKLEDSELFMIWSI